MNTNKPVNPYEQFQNDGTPEYNGQQMNHLQHVQHPQQVIVQPNTQVQTFTVEASPVKWSWCNLITAVISLCCCTIFGVVATITAVLAYVDHKAKDFERSKNKRNIAWGFGIAAIALGSIIIVSLIIFAIVISTKVTDAINLGLNNN